jgi:hypothetical protein
MIEILNEIRPGLIFLFSFCSLLLNVPAALLLDQLLKHEYRFHPESWEADGRPSGFLWCPRDAEWFDTVTWNAYFSYRWIFKTPDWIRSEPTCLKKLNLIRFLHALGTALFIVFLAFGIIHI